MPDHVLELEVEIKTAKLTLRSAASIARSRAQIPADQVWCTTHEFSFLWESSVGKAHLAMDSEAEVDRMDYLEVAPHQALSSYFSLILVMCDITKNFVL